MRLAIFTTLALAALAAGAGCSTKAKLAPDDYYKEASSAFADKNYDLAVTQYKALLDQYPFSEHAEVAELRIAESYYKNKKYPEAIAAFNDFQRMHPMSRHLAKVYYLLGMSYMDQMSTIDRDQTAADSAQGWFRVVVDRYPESPYAAKARRRRVTCREELAEHDLYIASFYMRRQNVHAAENRVKGILEHYPDTQAATRALEELATAYERAGDTDRAHLARAAFEERTAAFASLSEKARRAGAVPAVTTPTTDELLAYLDAHYGPSEAPASSAMPTLVDPVAHTTTKSVPHSGPGLGNEPSF